MAKQLNKHPCSQVAEKRARLSRSHDLAGSAEFVKAVLHRCVDLGWRDADLVRASGISKANWSAVRNYKSSPTIETVVKVCNAVGLQVDFKLAKKKLRADRDMTHPISPGRMNA